MTGKSKGKKRKTKADKQRVPTPKPTEWHKDKKEYNRTKKHKEVLDE